MKIHDLNQNTPEWLALRSGIVTASEMSVIITPTLKVSDGAGVDTYLYRKLAERWLGMPLMTFGGGPMEQGQILETEALPRIEFELGWELRRVGFVTTDDGRIGCSPDALIDPDSGAEIKCPQANTHVSYLLKGGLPREYAPQVNGSMLVTGRSSWNFVSYCRGFPLYIFKVERSERVMAMMRDAIEDFNDLLDAAYKRLVELNGGPPAPPAFDLRIEADGTEVRTMKTDANDAAAFAAFLEIPFQG